MLRKTSIQIAAVVAVAALLGYLAAAGPQGGEKPKGGVENSGENAKTSDWPRLPVQDNLPFPPTPSASVAGRTMQESVYRQRVEPRRLPKDAPNILIVLIDDVGAAQSSTFGGLINTPTMDRIVKQGVAYNRFHTTAMCSPTAPAAPVRAKPTPRRQRPDRRVGQ